MLFPPMLRNANGRADGETAITHIAKVSIENRRLPTSTTDGPAAGDGFGSPAPIHHELTGQPVVELRGR